MFLVLRYKKIPSFKNSFTSGCRRFVRGNYKVIFKLFYLTVFHFSVDGKLVLIGINGSSVSGTGHTFFLYFATYHLIKCYKQVMLSQHCVTLWWHVVLVSGNPVFSLGEQPSSPKDSSIFVVICILIGWVALEKEAIFFKFPQIVL